MKTKKNNIQKIKDMLLLSEYHKIPVPDFYEFSSIDVDVSPYDFFYSWIKEITSYPGPISVSDVWMTSEDYSRFEPIVKNWIQSTHALSRTNTETEYQWYNLEFGPAIFEKNKIPDWIEPGFIYIKKKTKMEKM